MKVTCPQCGTVITNTQGRCEGTVRWFDELKGYGFILTDAGVDVFIHYSEIVGDGYKKLVEGDRVALTAKDGPKGLSAAGVEVIQRAGEEE